MCLLCAIVSRIIGLFAVWVALEYLHLRFWDASLAEVQASSRLQGALFIALLVLFFGLLFLIPALTRSGLKRRSSDGARLIYGIFFLSGLIYVVYLSLNLEPTRRGMEVLLYVPAFLPGALFGLYFICFVIPGAYAYELARRAGDNVEIYGGRPVHRDDDAARKNWRDIGSSGFDEDDAEAQEISDTAILTNILVAGMVLVVLGSFWLDNAIRFVPSLAWRAFAEDQSTLITITAILTLVGCFVFFRNLTSRGRGVFATLLRLPVFAIFFGAFAFFIASTIARALPIALSYSEATQSKRFSFEIVEREERAKLKGCDYGIFVQISHDGFGERDRICGVHPIDWDDMKPGRSVTVTGSPTSYGMRYTKITR